MKTNNSLTNKIVSIRDILPDYTPKSFNLSNYFPDITYVVDEINRREEELHLKDKKPFKKCAYKSFVTVNYNSKYANLLKKHISIFTGVTYTRLSLLLGIKVDGKYIQKMLNGENFNKILLKTCEQLMGGDKEAKENVMVYLRKELEGVTCYKEALAVYEKMKNEKSVQEMISQTPTTQEKQFKEITGPSLVVNQKNSYVTKKNINILLEHMLIYKNRIKKKYHP